ncbi:MAG: endolytic transglycosylase MltG [Acidobacteriota bacterium]|nr:endolytic transglycosylase MltG [Acidobacteriota bacterium]
MKFLARMVAWLLIVAAAIGGWVFYRLNQPYKGFSEPVFVEFARGTPTLSMANTLVKNGVIQDRWLFLAARGLRRDKSLQAGEYRFENAASPLEVFGRIARGDIYYMELPVPEGYNMFDISEAVAKLGTMKAAAFLAAARNPALIRDLDARAPSLEGYLFPSKYRVYRHTTAQQLCRMMTDEFRQHWKALRTEANVHDTVTLASMVEREARRPDERPVVASVFRNRLKIGMKLDCDPTTVYAALLERRYRGTIYRSDLANESAWNTYQHAGLPPGPIANPGLSAMQAALMPAATRYLYFVARADGSGRHNFSESLLQHEAAVASYQRALHR